MVCGFRHLIREIDVDFAACAGSIVRINPDELSINDAEAYNDIYVSESRRRTDNYHSFIKGIDFDGQ